MVDNESQDGLATLEWIVQQPWYNDKIGTWGGSYYHLHSDGHANTAMGDGQLNRESPKYEELSDHFIIVANQTIHHTIDNPSVKAGLFYRSPGFGPDILISICAIVKVSSH